jgi:hypothetical protein
MFIKVDDDNDHNGAGEGVRAQGAVPVPGLRPADSDFGLGEQRFGFFNLIIMDKI